MKKALILLLFCVLESSAQKKDTAISLHEKYRFSVSVGSHLNWYQVSGTYGAPVNIQADYLFLKKNSLGLGYAYDSYKGGNNIFALRARAGDIRHHLSFRYLHYFRSTENVFTTYIGCSTGVSLWKDNSLGDQLIPTAQFIFGMRICIFKRMLWLHEFGLGPPFIYHSSLGFQF